MLWLWDARKWVETWSRTAGGYVTATAANRNRVEVPRIAWTTRNGSVDPEVDRGRINHDDWAEAGASFKWRRPARSLAAVAEPLFWDAGRLGVWWVGITEREVSDYESDRTWWSVEGYVRGRWTPAEWTELVCDGRWSTHAPEARDIAHAMRVGTRTAGVALGKAG